MNQIPIQFAPLQGYTEAPFRNFHEKYFGGVDRYFAPFLRVQHKEIRRKDQRDVLPDKNTVNKLIPQIMASEISEADFLVRFLVENGYRHIDINMGCPFPMLVRRHLGSGILPYPDEVARLLEITRHYPDIYFSVKIRLGSEQADECLRLVDLLNEFPLEQVAVHARLGVQQYKGDCDRMAFGAFAARCSHPLVYNGDIQSIEQIKQITTEFPQLSAIMIGRGLLAQPWLASEYMDGVLWDAGRKQQALRRFHADLQDYYVQTIEGGELQLLHKLQSFWEYFLVDADRKLRKKIKKATKMSAYSDAVYQLIRALE